MAKTKPALVKSGRDVAGLADLFFVVDDSLNTNVPDRFLVVQRQADYAACTVALFRDFDYAHFCAKRLSEYVKKHQEDPDTED